VLRHVLAILLLPFTAAVVVPTWLRTSFAAVDTRWGGVSLVEWLPRSLGVVLLVGGLALFSWCVSLFVRVGYGTLAPWDPTRRLVALGPYRYVRNPMISGVAMILIGQALVWGSWVTALWAAVFVLINHVYFVLGEEPGLERRFGASYLTYKAKVPRWIPRRKPADLNPP
jgi:protein-S-isoprenylcysteine O-methyltransferase Ste14